MSIVLCTAPKWRTALSVGVSTALRPSRRPDISEWIDDGQTALCPKCEIDSVIGTASGFPITHEFLMRMHEHWF